MLVGGVLRFLVLLSLLGGITLVPRSNALEGTRLGNLPMQQWLPTKARFQSKLLELCQMFALWLLLVSLSSCSSFDRQRLSLFARGPLVCPSPAGA